MQIGDIHGLAGLMHIFMYAALILTEMVDLKVRISAALLGPSL